jgi:hypothetical protein
MRVVFPTRLVRHPKVGPVILARRRRRGIERWDGAGRPIPPSHAFKQAVVLEHASRYGLARFVETGTWRGHMVEAVQHSFTRIDSIELSSELHAAASRRFRYDTHIHIHHGASEEVLPSILAELVEPALFWLDGHFSGGDTAQGAVDTPIVQELGHILAHHESGHVVLVDDARHFTGQGDYPSVNTLASLVGEQTPTYAMENDHDIVRFLPHR